MDKDKKKYGLETEEIWIITFLVILALSSGIFYYLNPFIHFFARYTLSSTSAIRSIFDFLIVISFPVSLIFLIGIIVSIERLKLIRKKERAIYGPPATLSAKAGAKGSPETTNRWKKIVALADSDNENDWKQAIIDADSILDEMLSRMNYHGDDLGSKLRGATPADFKTLEQASEAHGVRNRIAHDGSNFVISKHEAKRVVNLYRQVFEEFFYI
jgi:hypothetical protein